MKIATQHVKASTSRWPVWSCLPHIVLVIASFALLPKAQSVSPPPDGGYPGGNTAEGQSALLSLTTGGFNTAVGFLSLRSNTAGSFNTAVGAGTLLANVGDPSLNQGVENTATGAGALLSNTTGLDNTANGVFALFSNTTGANNTATGVQALLSNTTGGANTANGFQALANNTTGSFNMANGVLALSSNTLGGSNVANGVYALYSNTTGNYNTANGYQALYSNTTGSVNIALGAEAGSNVITAHNVIAIGINGADVSSTTWINNIYGTTTVSGTTLPVLVSDTGQLGTASSSRRFKKEIKPMEQASEAILALKPVTFHYKSDASGTPQFGLIAEEVAEVNPDLVVRDGNGEIYTVRYDAVNAMLLNEFLKEHRKVQRLEATVAQQRKDFQAAIAYDREEMQAAVAQLNERVQKVSAQLAAASPSRGGLEASKFAIGRIRRGGTAPQVVNHP